MEAIAMTTRVSAGTPKALTHLTVAERMARGKAARGGQRSAEHASREEADDYTASSFFLLRDHASIQR
jgi:hypothetical protein